MDRLTKIGSVKPVHSTQVKESTLGLGFEKLDRAVDEARGALVERPRYLDEVRHP